MNVEDIYLYFQKTDIPSTNEWNLCSLGFDDFSLDQTQMVVASVRMFLDLGLVSKFKMEYEVCQYFHWVFAQFFLLTLLKLEKIHLVIYESYLSH